MWYYALRSGTNDTTVATASVVTLRATLLVVCTNQSRLRRMHFDDAYLFGAVLLGGALFIAHILGGW